MDRFAKPGLERIKDGSNWSPFGQANITPVLGAGSWDGTDYD